MGHIHREPDKWMMQPEAQMNEYKRAATTIAFFSIFSSQGMGDAEMVSPPSPGKATNAPINDIYPFVPILQLSCWSIKCSGKSQMLSYNSCRAHSMEPLSFQMF